MRDNKNNPKKILVTTDTVGGVWTFCMELCSTLPHLQFHLVTMGAPLNKAQRSELKQLTNVAVYETDYKLEWMSDPWQDIDASGSYLLALEKIIQPDLVHLNAFAYGSLPFIAPVLITAHSDVFSWWVAVKNELPGPGWKEYFKRVQSGITKCDLLVAPSCWMMKVLHNMYGITTENRVIYNGRNPKLFYEKDKKQFVFTMGRVWDEAKNISCLTNAAKQTSYPVKIAGDQQFHLNHINCMVNSIEYMGRLDMSSVTETLAEAAIYVLPAKYEPFGLSALEAALSGCALVLANIPSLKEIWQDNAMYVDVNEPALLAQAINRLMSNKSLLCYYQKKAKQRAEKYTADGMAAAYLDAYTNLIYNQQTQITQTAA
ncbi:MAG: glycosyltransferase family 4 protein [Bacteroidota bacterium]